MVKNVQFHLILLVATLFCSFTSIVTLERLNEEKYSNIRNKEGKTPLMIAIENSVSKNKDEQIRIINNLKKQGVYLFDPEALAFAVKVGNIGALELMQPYYRLKDLYPEYKKTLAEYLAIKKRIVQSDLSANTKKKYEQHLAVLKKVLEILSKPVQPLEIKAPLVKNGKKQEKFIKISTVTGLYKLEQDYSIDPLAQ